MNRKIKKEVLALLAAGNLENSRRELEKYEEQGLVNPLFSALYRPEEILRWHTVTIFGEVLARLADKKYGSGTNCNASLSLESE